MLSGDNGILQKATDAKTQTGVGQEKETIALAYNSALAKKVSDGDSTAVSAGDLNTELANQGATADGNNPIKVTFSGSKRQYTINDNGIINFVGIKNGDDGGDDNVITAGNKATTTVKDNYTDLNEEKATIPAGFTVSNIDGEKNVDDGLVIYLIPDEVTPDWNTKATGENFTENTVYDIQTKYDQFVWIPVPEIGKMIMCKGHTDDTDSNKCVLELQEDETGKEILVCSKHNQEICGRLYATEEGDKYNKDLTTQKWADTFKEPILTSNEETSGYVSYVNGQGGTIPTLTDVQTEFMKMAVSVAKYGGFWIGRYESSLVSNKTRQLAGETSMKGNDGTSKMWYGLYARQSNFAAEQSITASVGSQMLWGSQYDAMLNWMAQDSTITVTSNAPKTGITKNTEKITGATLTSDGTTTINDKLKNIYDLLGCSYEWTQEANVASGRTGRGGSFLGRPSLSYRYVISASDASSDYDSSRLSLYVK